MEKERIVAEQLANLKQRVSELTQELQQKNRALEVEKALEHVRGRAINMRNSAELSETSALLFQQLITLGIRALRTGVGIFDDPNEAMEMWVTSVSNNQEVMRVLDYFSLHIHPVFENIIPARQQNKPYALTVLKDREVKKYYQIMSTYLAQEVNQTYRQEEFFYSFFFPHGAINVITEWPLTEEECSISIRFAQAFGLIYTRFQDLQKAEEQTIDALRQSSLERVRAEIASMRKTSDLNSITPLIWRELVNLDVPFIRCGVFIVSEAEKLVHAYLSTPDGMPLAVLHLPFEGGVETTAHILKSWREKRIFTDYWNREQFETWVNSMVEQGQVQEPEAFRSSSDPIETLYLYFTPFTQGMLYIGSTDIFDQNQISLIKSLADTFSVAYARYEDFKKLEDSKNQIEIALKELKATQSQLIQSEKMASLGELTAGIAHEIQNPLNFVNNFAEVNTELLEELKAESLKPKAEWSESIIRETIDNVIDNEQKISHHGKRADAIVKSMLQHSRTSAGKKELTDINALCDEYLRLAYHGLRAKDKTFNAKFETHLDPTPLKLNVIPQDIGRVLLNLINNAFHAVTLRRSKGDVSYQPTVWVSTQKLNDKILITVKDNGSGIPDSIKEKIFQPFFTTKPTGQGTGLGLSLSYDIVKAHGGELKVETKVNEGSLFSIQLPLTFDK